jgi:uncharacterized protein YsxB (DUF464 family)
MTKITFFKRGGVYYGFKETGHSGYADAGQDIVCAAISAMTMLIVNTIEISYATDVEYEIDEDSTDVTVKVPSILEDTGDNAHIRFAVSGLIQGYFMQLMDMLEDYYDYLSVEEIEK